MPPTAKSTPKDVFMHLLAIAALYISATSFGMLVFQFIDRWFPDPLIDYYAYSASFGVMRWAIASLVIVFPVYVWTARSVQKDATTNPEKRQLRIRKWLLYFTLFLAAAVIIGDLVALVYNFLGGDLSARFILKIAAVFFIAAAIFSYYLWNLKQEVMASRDPRMKWFIYAMVAIVGAAVVYGFFAVGSPFRERLRRFDERRVQNLQNIQWQVVSYWQKKEKLPAGLGDLRDEISGFTSPRDPESGSDYEYRILGDLKFELCAEFDTDSGRDVPKSLLPIPGELSENWMHEAGRKCFERTIDPELYKLGKAMR